MMRGKPTWLRWEALAIAAVLLYPAVCALLRNVFPKVDDGFGFDATFGNSLGSQLTDLFIYGILALALNVAVGYTGLLQLGIAAFFAIGVYITGVLQVQLYPFQTGYLVAIIASALGAAAFGVLLGSPTLRLRGDYLAIVTLGFAEVVKVTLRNLEQMIGGTKGLNLPAPQVPPVLAGVIERLGLQPDFRADFRLAYYVVLLILAGVVIALRNLERSRLGRAFIAIREDELAASCMGINVPRVKLAAFAISAALAGLAGSLYAAKLRTTGDPNNYAFSLSITMLCCVILGGLGSLRGTLLGVFLLMGFDYIVSPEISSKIQSWGVADSTVQWLRERTAADSNLPQIAERLLEFSNWRLMIFGLALILMMRFRPEGLLPSARLQHELHHDDSPAIKQK